jgi:hypothetical protein
MVKDVFRRDTEPAMRFTNELSRATNQKAGAERADLPHVRRAAPA